MQTALEVFVRAANPDQACQRALNGYYQAEPEDATRGMLANEMVFIIRVEAVASLPELAPTPVRKRPRKSSSKR